MMTIFHVSNDVSMTEIGTVESITIVIENACKFVQLCQESYQGVTAHPLIEDIVVMSSKGIFFFSFFISKEIKPSNVSLDG